MGEPQRGERDYDRRMTENPKGTRSTVVNVALVAAFGLACGLAGAMLAGWRPGRTAFYCWHDEGGGKCYRTADDCRQERDELFSKGVSGSRCYGRENAYCFDSGESEWCYRSMKDCESIADYTEGTGCEERR